MGGSKAAMDIEGNRTLPELTIQADYQVAVAGHSCSVPSRMSYHS
jgi:hypothetical protein